MDAWMKFNVLQLVSRLVVCDIFIPHLSFREWVYGVGGAGIWGEGWV